MGMRIKNENSGGRLSSRMATFSGLSLSILSVLSMGLLWSCGGGGDRGEIGGSGSIEVREVRISPLIPGRIKTIHVDEGDLIKEGDLLVTLVADEVHADVDFNRAAREGARRAVEQARASYKNAKAEMERAERLFKAGILSKQDRDRASTRYSVSLSTLESARARVSQGEAALSRASTRLRETLLSSPLNGVVLSKNFEEGEVVLPGSAILSVADPKEAYLRIYVSTGDLARIRTGQRAEVTVEGAEHPFAARVVHIAEKSEFTPKNVQTREARSRLVFGVKLQVENRDLILKPGMPADGVILTKLPAGKADPAGGEGKSPPAKKESTPEPSDRKSEER